MTTKLILAILATFLLRASSFLLIIQVSSALFAETAPTKNASDQKVYLQINLKVLSPWNEKTKTKYYSQKEFNYEGVDDPTGDFDSKIKFWSEVILLSPLRILPENNVGFSAYEYDQQVPHDIAKNCSNLFPSNTWVKIACISYKVWSIVTIWKRDRSIGKLADCKTNAILFVDTFNQLEVPYSDVGIYGAHFHHSSGQIYHHVANRFTVSGKDGKYYTYVIDTGFVDTHQTDAVNITIHLFPLTPSTVYLHDQNNDNEIDFHALPELWGDG